MTNHVQKEKLRKSSFAYKQGRANARKQNSAQTAKPRSEPRSEHRACKCPDRNWDHCFTIHSTTTGNKSEIWWKQVLQLLNFWHWNKHYRKICWALSIISYWPNWPLSIFNLHFTCPWHWSFRFKSKLKVNNERKLYKDNKEVHTLPLKEAMSQFLGLVSRSVERSKSRTNKHVITVLLGHNSLTFDKQSC